MAYNQFAIKGTLQSAREVSRPSQSFVASTEVHHAGAEAVDEESKRNKKAVNCTSDVPVDDQLVEKGGSP